MVRGIGRGVPGGSGTPLEIFSIELVSQGHLQTHQPPVQHKYQAACKHMHSQHDMATHIQLASGFRASTRFYHDRS